MASQSGASFPTMGWWMALGVGAFLQAPFWWQAAPYEMLTAPWLGLSLLVANGVLGAVVFFLAPAWCSAWCHERHPRPAEFLTAAVASGTLIWCFLPIRGMPAPVWWLGLIPMLMLAPWRSMQKGVIVLALLFGVGLVAVGCATSWRGLVERNSYTRLWVPPTSSEVVSLHLHFAQDGFLAMAPVLLIAWSVGRLRPKAGELRRAALLGVALPSIVVAGLVGAAAQAGSHLYYQPSLPTGAEWAWAGFVESFRVPVYPFLFATYWAGWLAPLLALREGFAASRQRGQGPLHIVAGLAFGLMGAVVSLWWDWKGGPQLRYEYSAWPKILTGLGLAMAGWWCARRLRATSPAGSRATSTS